MTRRPSGILPPLVAAVVTLLLAWFMGRTSAGTSTVDPLQGMMLILLVPAPLLVSVVWGWALLAAGSPRKVALAALGWLVVGLVVLPAGVVWQLAGNVAAGLLAGLALGLRWRLDAALAAVVVVLLPLWVWSVVQVPVTEQLEALNDEILGVIEESLPAGATPEDRARALEQEERRLARVTDLAGRIYPFGVGVGLVGQAGIILALVWFAAGRLGVAVAGWRLPPFAHWRLPFYLVWALIVGLGMMLTRLPHVADAGLNLALFTAFVLSAQGIAVQYFVTRKVLPGPGRVVYWLVMGGLFAPLVMVSGALLGLVDQWTDLRRLGDSADPGAGEPGDIE